MARAGLSQSTVMILRSLLRWPLRSCLTALGLALAAASIIAATFINDALDEIIDLAFAQTNRQGATLIFATDLPEAAIEKVRHLDGNQRLDDGPLSVKIRLLNIASRF